MNETTVTGFESIVKRIGDLPQALHGLQDVLLANLAMIAEIPAPTFDEGARAVFVQERFAELGYSDCSIDEVGNVAGVLAGSENGADRNILLVAHTDTPVAATVDHTVVVQPDRVTGPSVADNSLGLAVVAAMPAVLERLGLSLRSTVLGLACSRGLGRGNLEGVRFFLEHAKLPLQFGLCVEGVQLGRLSYTSIGMIRGEIACEVPEEYDWTRFGAGGAISTLNDIISRMLEIPTPDRPRTTIVLGRIEGGTSASTVATRASPAVRGAQRVGRHRAPTAAGHLRDHRGGVVPGRRRHPHDRVRTPAAGRHRLHASPGAPHPAPDADACR